MKVATKRNEHYKTQIRWTPSPGTLRLFMWCKISQNRKFEWTTTRSFQPGNHCLTMSTNIWVVDWREFRPTLAVPSKPSIFEFVYGDFIQSKLLSNLELGAQKKTDKALTVPSSTFFEQFSSDSKTWLWKTVHKNWQFQFWSIFKNTECENTNVELLFCWLEQLWVFRWLCFG